MNATAEQVTTLESETCSRCGGSGRYSYCQMCGDRCFKCCGKGKVLTKRGAAANVYLRQIRSKRAADLQVGDVYRLDGIPGFSGDQWIGVQAVEPSNGGMVYIVGNLMNYQTSPDTMLRVRQSREDAHRTFTMAIEYQNSLTKNGEPRKRGAS